MTPEDLRDEIAKWRRRRDNPEPLDLQEPVEYVSHAEYARRFPVESTGELDAALDAIWGPT